MLGDERPLGLDGGHLLLGEGHASGRDLLLVEGALLVVGPVAVVDPIDEVEQAAQRQDGVCRSDLHLGVDGEIAQLVNAEQRAPHAFIEALFE